MWGVALIALGLLTGLGTYVDAAGPLGRGLSDGFGALIGALRVLAPVGLVVGGALLLRGPRHGDGDDAPGGHRPARVVVGTALVLVAACGLLHLLRGQPEPDAPLEDIAHAGGYVGIAVGGPLRDLLAPWGAGLVLAAVGLIGLVVATGISVRTAARRTADGVRPVRRGLRRGVDSLFDLGGRADTGPVITTDDGLTIFDAELEDGPAPTQRARTRADAMLPELVDDESLDELDDRELQVFVAGEDDAAAGESEGDEELDIHVPTAEESPSEVEQLAMDVGPSDRPVNWKLPSPRLLERSEHQEVNRSMVEERGRVLEAALAEHGVQTRLVGMVVGPTVTRYELELGPGVKVARVTSLHKDIAYAMAAADVRILAPIPGKQAIGVEVPNDTRQLVAVGDILASPEARAATNPLEVAIGRDINGRAVLADLATMPHILIAGATGAGKSSCLNSLLTSILMRTTPDEVRMILVDPKRVEMGQYNRLPHLLTQVVTNPKKAANALAWAVKEMDRRYELLSEVGYRDIKGFNEAVDRGDLYQDPDADQQLHRLPYILVDPKRVEMGQYNRLPHLLTQVVTNPKKAANALAWAVKEMDRRYDLLSEVGFRDISGYNAAFDRGDLYQDPEAGIEYHRLPYILVVVDELADLMMVAARDVEESITRLAAMARAVGIHLVIATQRPSVNVITGVIKANVPARLAFAVASLQDSRVILDQAGAEKLLGRGDMLLLGPSSSVAQRIQGAWVTESEVRSIVAAWRRQSPEVSYDDDAVQGTDDGSSGASGAAAGGGAAGDDDDEELVRQAMELVVRSQLGSTSMLQRKLRVGFARAGRLMDLLEQRGVVGPSEGSKARAVLMTPEELDEHASVEG